MGTITPEEWNDMVECFDAVTNREGVARAHHGQFNLPGCTPAPTFDPMPLADPLFENTVGQIIEQATMEEVEKAIENGEECVFVRHLKRQRRDDIHGRRKKIKKEVEDNEPKLDVNKFFKDYPDSDDDFATA